MRELLLLLKILTDNLEITIEKYYTMVSVRIKKGSVVYGDISESGK